MIMFRIAIIFFLLFGLVWALKFENCATSPLTTAFNWRQLDMYPLPLIFPDQVHVDVNIQVLKNITNPLVDTDSYRIEKGHRHENALLIPCDPSTYIGTCRNIDLCAMIDRLNNKKDSYTPSFQEQIVEILMTSQGSWSQSLCSTLASPDTEKHATIDLPRLNPALHELLHGDFTLQVSVKDDPASRENVGCIRFNFTIVDAPIPPTTTPTTTLGGPLPPDYTDYVG